MTQKHGYSYDKIKIITALIYLNMSPLHEKKLDHLLFVHAITLLSNIYD